MLSALLKRYMAGHAKKVQSSMRDPLAAQTAVFGRLRKLLRGSGIATQSGFDRCTRFEDCRHLPISDSESLQPLFKRAFSEGAQASRIFGRSRIAAFGRTSGTLSEPKDIPLNQEYFKSFDRSLLRMIACQLHSTGEWKYALTGRRILLGSRPMVGHSPTGLPIADISGLLLTRSSRLARRLYIPKHEDHWTDDWPIKAERILEQAYGKRVVSITGIPALALDFAKRAQAKYRINHLTELWPELALYVYGGMHLSPDQKKQLARAWYGDERKLHTVETYFATEGALGFSTDPHSEGLALNTLENLFLFLSDETQGIPVFAHELQVGRTYSVLMTTAGGLINYRIGDRIKVLSTHPLLISVVGREKEVLSMTGEKVTLEQIDLALDATGLPGELFGFDRPIVWIESGEKPHLVWCFPASVGPLDPLSLSEKLDEALCRFNVLYSEALVNEKVIERSKLVFLPVKVFSDYRNSRLGAGQAKPKRIFNSRLDFETAYGCSKPAP